MSTVVLCEWDECICPICAEEMDGSDISMFPCPCEYQICLWCLKRIREDSAKCPLCRRPYDDQSMTKVNPPKRLIRKPKPVFETMTSKVDQGHVSDVGGGESRNDMRQSAIKTQPAAEFPTLRAPVISQPIDHSTAPLQTSSSRPAAAERASGPMVPPKKGWLTTPHGPPACSDNRNADGGDDTLFPSLAATVPKVEPVKLESPPTAPAPRTSETAAARNHGTHTRKSENPFQTICANQTKLKLFMLPPPPSEKAPLGDNSGVPVVEPAPPCKVAPPPPALPQVKPLSAEVAVEIENSAAAKEALCLQRPLPPSQGILPSVCVEDLAPPPGFDQLGSAVHLPPPPGITAPPLQVYAQQAGENSFARSSYEHIYNPHTSAFGYASGGGGSVDYYKQSVQQQAPSASARYERLRGGEPDLPDSLNIPRTSRVSQRTMPSSRRSEVPVYPPPFRPPGASAKDVLNDNEDLFGWDAYDDAGTQWLDGLLNMHLGQGSRYNGQLMQQSSFVSSTDFEWQRPDTNPTEQIVNRLLGQPAMVAQPPHYMQHTSMPRQPPVIHQQHLGYHQQQPPLSWQGPNHYGMNAQSSNSINHMASNMVPGLTGGGGCVEHVNGQLNIDILRSVIPNAKISILEPCQRSR